MTRCHVICLLSVFTVALASVTLAQSVITPSGVTATSSYSTYSIDNVRNGVGMVNTSGDVSTWTHSSVNVGNWLGVKSGGQVLIFTLPSPSTVGALYAWQYDRNNVWNNRAINTFDISFSTDNGVTYPTTITGLSLYMEPETGTVTPVQTRAFTQQSGVTHVKLTLLSNWGDATYYGLGEMYFGEGSAGLPAPDFGSVSVDNIWQTSADLHGTLTGGDSDVAIFWDTVDRGETFAWANTNSPADAYDGTSTSTAITYALTGLDAGQTYHYAFYGSNATDTAWSFGSFTTRTRAEAIQPVSATNPSYLDTRTAQKLVDGSGIFNYSEAEILTLSNDVATAMNTHYWLSAVGNPGTNTFVLHEAADVDGIFIWPYNSTSTTRQLLTFSLSFSTDGGASYSSTVSGGPLSVVPGTNLVPHQTVLFARQSGVTHIRMLDMVNGGDSCTGLGEIRLKRAQPPPAGTLISFF